MSSKLGSPGTSEISAPSAWEVENGVTLRSEESVRPLTTVTMQSEGWTKFMKELHVNLPSRIRKGAYQALRLMRDYVSFKSQEMVPFEYGDAYRAFYVAGADEEGEDALMDLEMGYHTVDVHYMWALHENVNPRTGLPQQYHVRPPRSKSGPKFLEEPFIDAQARFMNGEWPDVIAKEVAKVGTQAMPVRASALNIPAKGGVTASVHWTKRPWSELTQAQRSVIKRTHPHGRPGIDD